jgi:hypothetical protein
MSEPWRVGRKVPVNVYVGDVIAGQFQTAILARVAVEAVNARAELEAQPADAGQAAQDEAMHQIVRIARASLILEDLRESFDCLGGLSGWEANALDSVEAALACLSGEKKGEET